MGRLEYEVRELILDQDRSLAAFARRIGISKNTLYSALHNGFAGSTLSTINPIVEALGLDITEFAQGRAVAFDHHRKSVPVPLFDSITANTPIEFDNADDVFPIPAELHQAYPQAFMLKARGTSMNRVLPEGSYALIEPCSKAESVSEIYVVGIGGETATLKHVRPLSNGVELIPDSDDPTHHPIVYDRADESAPSICILGRVVWHCSPLGIDASE